MIMNVLKTLAAAAILCISGTAFGQQAQLKGNIKGLGDAELNFHYYEGGEAKTSNVKVTGDKFTWTAPMPNPQKITIMFPKRAVWIFVEQGNMEITGTADSLNKLKLTGSKIQAEADAYDKLLQPFSSQEMPLYQKYGKVSKEEQLALEQKLADIRKQKRELADKYISEHPESAFSLSMVADRAGMGEYQDIQAMYNKLGKTVKATPEGKRIAERLVILKRSAIGEKMLDFTQNDMEGKPVSFSAFQGKYVLVDFWASWCGPCRAENPNVLKAYNNYKDKNFTVVGISLDDKGDNWKKAVKDDGMPWTQLSDLKGWKNEVSTYYGIMGIPSTLLIDPQGKIIAKNLRGEILNKKLEELFNN
jgi:peroxiredoxin